MGRAIRGGMSRNRLTEEVTEEVNFGLENVSRRDIYARMVAWRKREHACCGVGMKISPNASSIAEYGGVGRSIVDNLESGRWSEGVCKFIPNSSLYVSLRIHGKMTSSNYLLA